MTTFPRKVLFVLLSATVVFAVGCRKKPKRNDPNSTVLGQSGSLTPGDSMTFGTQLEDPNSALSGRDGVIDDGKTIRGLLQPVYFAFNQSAITAAERTKLQAAQAYLNENPQHGLLLEGHCDWRGTAEYNLGLGDRRASSVQEFLIQLGVPKDRLRTVSYGKERPQCTDSNESCWQQNRRAHFSAGQ